MEKANTESLKDSWKPGICRRLAADDGFFDEGNNVCFVDSIKKYTCLSANDHSDDDDDDDIVVETKKTTSKDLFCLEGSCDKTLRSLFLFELHYDTAHRNVCSECKVHLPTFHLLDLHIQERHSSAVVGFRCIVLGCPESFSTPEDRRRHVVDSHRYPPNFRYFVYLGKKPEPKEKSSRKSSSKSRKESSAGRQEEDDEGGTVTSNNNLESDETCTRRQEVGDDVKVTPKRRVPSQICFGKSSHRGFVTRTPRR